MIELLPYILIVFVLTWISWKIIGYEKTYYLLGCSMLIFIWLDMQQYFPLSYNAKLNVEGVFIVVCPLLLILSVSNFIRQTGVNFFVSIAFMFFCSFMIFILLVALGSAGTGMLG